MKNPGKQYEIIEGTYMGKFCISRNKNQIGHYLKQKRLFVELYDDILCTIRIKDESNGKNLVTIIHVDKLKLIGFID